MHDNVAFVKQHRMCSLQPCKVVSAVSIGLNKLFVQGFKADTFETTTYAKATVLGHKQQQCADPLYEFVCRYLYRLCGFVQRYLCRVCNCLTFDTYNCTTLNVT